LPQLPEVAKTKADIAWFVYDLELVPDQNRYQIVPHKTIYTQFGEALRKITTPEAGSIEDFVADLQVKLDEKLENHFPPDTPTLADVIQQ
jgi:hypothetical protein